MKEISSPKIVFILLGLFTTINIYTQTMPTISTESNEIWYDRLFKEGGAILQDRGNNSYLRTKNSCKKNDAQLWKITDSHNNCTIISKAEPKIGVVGTSNSLRYTATEGTGIKIKFVPSTNTIHVPAWMMGRAVEGNGCINQWSGVSINKELGEWNNSGDANNTLNFKLSQNMDFKPEKPATEATLFGTASPPDAKYALWYRQPATNWMKEALPIGNGQFGAMFFGGLKQEEVQFNDKTLWKGSTKIYGAYQNFGSLFINSRDIQEAKNYKRTLDIQNAIGQVEYETNGVKYRREYFSSYPDSAVIIRYTSDASAKINIDIMLWGAHKEQVSYLDNSITFNGKLELLSYYAKATVKNEGGGITTKNDRIIVTDANAVTIVLRGKTNFSLTNSTHIYNPTTLPTEVDTIINNVLSQPYETVKSNHITDYKALYDRVKLNLGNTTNSTPTDVLLERYNKGDHSLFMNELYFQYGRYLFISSARGINLPANLQGIWNNNNTPPWGSDMHSNINVEMNYWLAENTNLSELHNTFLNYIYTESTLHKQWQQNAKDAGQTKGWTIYTGNNIFGWHNGFMHNYVIANAWYTMHLWQHYRYTLDEDFLLEKAYPAMKTCAEFWMERLIDDIGNTQYGFSPDGTLVCPNEYSPEHGPKKENGVAHAQQLVWNLFNNTLQAMEVLGEKVKIDTDFKALLTTKFEKLDPGIHIDTDGYLREWKYSPRSVGTPKHRHMSHLIGLYPGNQISPFIDKKVFDAALKSMNERGDTSTGWSMGWKINLWARALNGNRAYRILNLALNKTEAEYQGNGGVYTNLLDAHPPFQIDGNFGATAGITEMLLQSHMGIIQLLPALPDVWKDGKVSGLRATNQFEVAIEWRNNTPQKASIISYAGKKCTLHYKGIKTAIVTNATTGEKVTTTAIDNDRITFPTATNATYNILFVDNAEIVKNTLEEGL